MFQPSKVTLIVCLFSQVTRAKWPKRIRQAEDLSESARASVTAKKGCSNENKRGIQRWKSQRDSIGPSSLKRLMRSGVPAWWAILKGGLRERRRYDYGIAVAHGEFLSDEQRECEAKHGSLLVEQGRFFRCRIGLAGGQTFADVDKDILDFAFGAEAPLHAGSGRPSYNLRLSG